MAQLHPRPLEAENVVVLDPPQDPRWVQVHRAPAKADVPFVPTNDAVVGAMLHLAKVKPGDVVYDLGCGDGRIAIAAAELGARAVGIDVDLQRIKECYWNAKRAGVSGRVKFVRQSLFDADFRDATVVTMYLLTSINLKLRPKLLFDLRPGARVVSHFFEMGDWPPDQTTHAYQRPIHLWTIPAWVQGRWKGVVDNPDGRRRRHLNLDLHRHYQRVTGTARFGVRAFPIQDGRIDGDRLTFRLPDPAKPSTLITYEARMTGAQLRGTWQATPAAPPAAWAAVRT